MFYQNAIEVYFHSAWFKYVRYHPFKGQIPQEENATFFASWWKYHFYEDARVWEERYLDISYSETSFPLPCWHFACIAKKLQLFPFQIPGAVALCPRSLEPHPHCQCDLVLVLQEHCPLPSPAVLCSLQQLDGSGPVRTLDHWYLQHVLHFYSTHCHWTFWKGLLRRHQNRKPTALQSNSG